MNDVGTFAYNNPVLLLLLPDSGLAIILLIVVSLLAMLLSLLTLIDHQTCPVLFQNNSVRALRTFK